MVSIEREGSTLQGSEYRDHLNNNWKIIEDELNRLGKLTETDGEQVTKQDIENLKLRINRIVLGIDTATIELIVTQILAKKGVI